MINYFLRIYTYIEIYFSVLKEINFNYSSNFKINELLRLYTLPN